MANEFKIKHGFISTGSGTVEGELRITGASYADNGSRIATRPWVTQYLSDNSYATSSDITTAISNLVDSAPTTLDTLNELAAAIGDDPNFATSISTSIAGKLPLAGGTMTGSPMRPAAMLLLTSIRTTFPISCARVLSALLIITGQWTAGRRRRAATAP